MTKRRKEEQNQETKAIKGGRICFDCATPIHDPAIVSCPFCGCSDLDPRRSKPTKRSKRKKVDLPHPFKEINIVEGGAILLSGGPGSGKTTICTKTRPTVISTSEQEPDQVAEVCRRVNPGEPIPLICASTSWEEVEHDFMTLKKGEIGILDSISQISSGPESSKILSRLLKNVRSAGAIAIFVTQYTKDGEMLGPNELRHMVDVVASIPDDNSGMRRLAVSKNRFGSLFSAYFTITDTGVEEQKFQYVYSVEGPPGRYSLHLYPMGGAKFTGILEALQAAKVKITGIASAAVASSIYPMGFVEPEDAMWRRKFAEEHGLKWIDPEEAWEIINRENEDDDIQS